MEMMNQVKNEGGDVVVNDNEEDEDAERKNYEAMLRKVKGYVEVLEKESEYFEGGEVSQRILQKFDRRALNVKKGGEGKNQMEEGDESVQKIDSKK